MGGVRRGRLGGSSLIELLIAVIFLGIGATTIVSAVSTGATRALYAKHRETALALVQNQIDAVRITSRTSSLTVGTTVTTGGASNIPAGVTVTTTISLVSGYTNLYDVAITATWPEKSKTDSLKVETYVRAIDA